MSDDLKTLAEEALALSDPSILFDSTKDEFIAFSRSALPALAAAYLEHCDLVFNEETTVALAETKHAIEHGKWDEQHAQQHRQNTDLAKKLERATEYAKHNDLLIVEAETKLARCVAAITSYIENDRACCTREVDPNILRTIKDLPGDSASVSDFIEALKEIGSGE